MHFLVIGHLDGADPDWELSEGESAAASVEAFVRHTYDSAGYVEEASFADGEPTLDRIAQHWREGENMEDINLPPIHIDHVFTSEARITAENASSFAEGIPA